MVTRLYFPVTDASEVNPAFYSTWNYTSEALRRKLANVKGSSAITIGSQIGAWASGNHALDRQYVSTPMDSGISFSGVTVKCQIMAREYNNGDNTHSEMAARIVNRAGDTDRQVLLLVNNLP